MSTQKVRRMMSMTSHTFGVLLEYRNPFELSWLNPRLMHIPNIRVYLAKERKIAHQFLNRSNHN